MLLSGTRQSTNNSRWWYHQSYNLNEEVVTEEHQTWQNISEGKTGFERYSQICWTETETQKM